MEVKIAKTAFDVHPIIKNRWSARSFSEKPMTDEVIKTIIEAGHWMFSAMNEQPWRFIYAKKNTAAFDLILSSLAHGNAVWAKNAGAFVVSIVKTDFDKEGNPFNAWAEHDMGAANAGMILQASTMDIYAHPMAGFKPEIIKEYYNLPDNLKPFVVNAFGYLDEPQKLEEPFLTRETTARSRKNLEEIILFQE